MPHLTPPPYTPVYKPLKQYRWAALVMLLDEPLPEGVLRGPYHDPAREKNELLMEMAEHADELARREKLADEFMSLPPEEIDAAWDRMAAAPYYANSRNADSAAMPRKLRALFERCSDEDRHRLMTAFGSKLWRYVSDGVPDYDEIQRLRGHPHRYTVSGSWGTHRKAHPPEAYQPSRSVHREILEAYYKVGRFDPAYVEAYAAYCKARDEYDAARLARKKEIATEKKAKAERKVAREAARAAKNPK